MNQINYQAESDAMIDDLVAYRRDFHQHPETAFEETRTSRIVANELAQLGLEVQTGIGKTGVIGILEGCADGPTILLRADIDALPIKEANNTPYVSQTDGKMHACGHDGHTAIALGVARLWTKHRDKLHGRVKFVFQPAEEIGAGARAMIADGALQDPVPDVSLGLHLWNTMPLGKVGLTAGPIMAGASIFTIQIMGKGGHAAIPDLAIDPIICASQLVTALQTIASRNADPLDAVVLSVTQFHAGSANNVIPDVATLSGTFRTYTPQMRALVNQRLQEIVTGMATTMQCEATLKVDHFTEPVVNHPNVVQRIKHAFQQFPSLQLVEERTMGSEDVGEFMATIPGAFFFLGSADTSRQLDFPHHHPRFDFDEATLPLGVALLASAIGEYTSVE